MRLDKLLCLNAIGSRKIVKIFIKTNQVKVNGHVITDETYQVKLDKDVVYFKDFLINSNEYIYIMMNKKAGYVCANHDKVHLTVFELLNFKRNDLFTVGRLDLDTEGLLLITNDGSLAHKITSPKMDIVKTYYLEYIGDLPIDYEEILKKGIHFKDFTTKPAFFKPLDKNSGTIEISEGKFHQVKKMINFLGCEVTYLKRIKIGNLMLDPKLKKGEYKFLTLLDINNIFI